jgi:hypothetical protein
MACGQKAKSERLGMSVGTANARLLRDIIFDLISQTGNNFCCHCGKHMTRNDFSIEHKQAWLNSERPVELFFDLENISFSHLRCNVGEMTNWYKLTPEALATKTKHRRAWKAEWMRKKRAENPDYGREGAC